VIKFKDYLSEAKYKSDNKLVSLVKKYVDKTEARNTATDSLGKGSGGNLTGFGNISGSTGAETRSMNQLAKYYKQLNPTDKHEQGMINMISTEQDKRKK